MTQDRVSILTPATSSDQSATCPIRRAGAQAQHRASFAAHRAWLKRPRDRRVEEYAHERQRVGENKHEERKAPTVGLVVGGKRPSGHRPAAPNTAGSTASRSTVRSARISCQAPREPPRTSDPPFSVLLALSDPYRWRKTPRGRGDKRWCPGRGCLTSDNFAASRLEFCLMPTWVPVSEGDS